MREGEILVIARVVRKGAVDWEGEILVITRAVRKGAVGGGGRNTGHN